MEPMYVQAGTRLAGGLPAGGADAIHQVNMALEHMAQMGARLAEAQSQVCAVVERAQTQLRSVRRAELANRQTCNNLG